MPRCGVCLARSESIRVSSETWNSELGEWDDTKQRKLMGLSTTVPRIFEQTEVWGQTFYDVFMPELRDYISITGKEFEDMFLVVNPE